MADEEDGDRVLSLYRVYWNGRLATYAVRQFDVYRERPPVASRLLGLAPTLGVARGLIPWTASLRIGHVEGDDEAVVETWL